VEKWRLSASSRQRICPFIAIYPAISTETRNNMLNFVSPDRTVLSLCDFWLFPKIEKLKKALKGKRFDDIEKIKREEGNEAAISYIEI